MQVSPPSCEGLAAIFSRTARDLAHKLCCCRHRSDVCARSTLCLSEIMCILCSTGLRCNWRCQQTLRLGSRRRLMFRFVSVSCCARSSGAAAANKHHCAQPAPLFFGAGSGRFSCSISGFGSENVGLSPKESPVREEAGGFLANSEVAAWAAACNAQAAGRLARTWQPASLQQL